MIIVSIGMQCTVKLIKREIYLDSASLPFDYILSSPKFVYNMLKMLLHDNIDIHELVTQHFFKCDSQASILIKTNDYNDDNYRKFFKLEHYITNTSGTALYNTKYDVIFPHDHGGNEDIKKYVRRFEKLKYLILNNHVKLCFVYASQSSLTDGNYKIDGREIISNIYVYLSKIYKLISKYNNNFEMIVFDCINNENVNNLNPAIKLYKLSTLNSYTTVIKSIINLDMKTGIFDLIDNTAYNKTVYSIFNKIIDK
jgi:hypothetical protein